MSTAPIAYQLDQQQTELLLIALHVFDQLRDNPYTHELVSRARKFYRFEPLPGVVDAGDIGQLADVLFNGLFEARLTPADRLLDYDIDGLGDADALAIVRGIEARYGPITSDDLGRALASGPSQPQLWEHGTVRIPYAAYKLLRIMTGYDLPSAGWENWCLHSGYLWSPAGDRFDPARLAYLANPLAMADMWRKDYERRNALRKQQALQAQLRLGKPPLRLIK